MHDTVTNVRRQLSTIAAATDISDIKLHQTSIIIIIIIIVVMQTVTIRETPETAAESSVASIPLHARSLFWLHCRLKFDDAIYV